MPLRRTTPCGARTRAGKPCQQPAMANGRCKMHGGRAPTGPANGNYKHGRYSQHLPPALQARYDAAEADPDLISLRADLALQHVRMGEVIERLATGESGELWQALGRHMIALRVAERDANRETDEAKRDALGLDRERAIDAMESLIREALDNERVWRDIEGQQEHKRKLVESEQKRLKDLQQMITAEQALLRDNLIFEVIKRHVTDRAALALIGADIRQLAFTEPGRPALPVGRRGRRRDPPR